MNDDTDQTNMIENFVDKNDLFSQANAYWLYGQWEQLTEYTKEDILNQQQRAQIASFVASAFLQLEQSKASYYWLELAISWGMEKASLLKILFSGINNTLGRIALLKQDDELAGMYFRRAVNVAKNSELLVQSRVINELVSLGLLPQASKLVSNHFNLVSKNPSKIKDLSAHLKVLDTNVELLRHELSISQQRLQLYQAENNEISNTKVGLEEYLKKLEQRSVSQLGQDIWVLKKTNFKTNGFFVEFGATDGVLLSNTYLLEKEFNWDGICAEPNPKFFEKLKKNRSCKVSDSCIAAKSGEKVDFIFADEFGGIESYSNSDMHGDKRKAFRETYGSNLIETISLNDFLEQFNAPENIDYISIDTEGSEFDILNHFNFDRWNVSIFSVEHNFTEAREKIHSLLTSKGYSRFALKWDDIYFIDRN